MRLWLVNICIGLAVLLLVCVFVLPNANVLQ